MLNTKRNRPLLLVLTVLLLLGAFTGCGGTKSAADSDGAGSSGVGNKEPMSPSGDIADTVSDTAAGPVYYTLPDKIKQVVSLCTGADGVIYFAAYLEEAKNPDAPADEAADVYTKLFKINIDGTGLTELEGYTAPVAEGKKNEKMYLSCICTDNEGNLLVVEFNVSDAKEDPYILLRRLDLNGAELSKTDITELYKSAAYIYISDIETDAAGNIYLSDFYSGVQVFDSSCSELFNLPLADANVFMSGIARTAEGDIACLVYENNKFTFKVVNAGAKSWSAQYTVSMALDIYPAAGGYDLMYNDNSSLCGFSFKKSESVKCFSFSDYTKGMNLTKLAALAEKTVICALDSGYGTKTELAILPLTPPPVDTEKTVLRLAGFGLGGFINDAVSAFNSSNAEYRIEAVDYLEYNTDTDPEGGFKKLDADIISDNMPDLIVLNPRVVQKKYAAKGLFEDLYPYLDKDASLGGREAILPDILRICDTDGKLYQLPPGFWIYTAAGLKSKLGDIGSLTFEEMEGLTEKYPDAKQVFPNMTSEDMLRILLFNMDKFVDWENARCDFNNESFIRMLEFAGRYPVKLPETGASDNEKQVKDGKALLTVVPINSFYMFELYETMFEDEMEIVGFPSDSGNGSMLFLVNSLSISSRSRYKDAAWSFVSSVLSEAMQTKDSLVSFPVNKAAFDAMAKEATEKQTTTDENGEEVEVSKGTVGSGDTQVPMYAVPKSYVEAVKEIIGGINSTMQMDQVILNIINEEAAPYFSGQVSAEKAAEVIQSRVQIYISEQQ
jgi:ABC-type glycerol-3-phosphate transport system substrate-binding protein